MKKLYYFFLLSFGFIVNSCSDKGKADAIAAKMVEAQISGYYSEINQAENELREWGRSLSSDESSEMEEYFKEALTENFMKAFDEELSDIAENVRSRSYYSIERSYEKFSKKVDKIDEKYRRLAYASLPLYLSRSFSNELEEYAEAVLKAIKDGEKYQVGRGDKKFVETCERISDKSSNVSNALKTAYRDVLKKYFEEYIKDNMKEYESLCKKGNKEEAEKWLKDYQKQIDRILSDASDEVKAAFSEVNQSNVQDIMKQIEESL